VVDPGLDPDGYGPWSRGKSFIVWDTGPPGLATLISPSGTIADTTPTYVWQPVASRRGTTCGVNDSTGNKIKQWYTASDVGCAMVPATVRYAEHSVATGAGHVVDPGLEP